MMTQSTRRTERQNEDCRIHVLARIIRQILLCHTFGQNTSESQAVILLLQHSLALTGAETLGSPPLLLSRDTDL